MPLGEEPSLIFYWRIREELLAMDVISAGYVGATTSMSICEGDTIYMQLDDGRGRPLYINLLMSFFMYRQN